MSSDSDIALPNISRGSSVMPMALPSDLLILSTPSRPSRSGRGITTRGASRYSRIRSRAAHLAVRLQRHRVVALRQRIEQLVQGDRLVLAVAAREVIALQDARHGVLGRQFDEAVGAE